MRAQEPRTAKESLHTNPIITPKSQPREGRPPARRAKGRKYWAPGSRSSLDACQLLNLGRFSLIMWAIK